MKDIGRDFEELGSDILAAAFLCLLDSGATGVEARSLPLDLTVCFGAPGVFAFSFEASTAFLELLVSSAAVLAFFRLGFAGNDVDLGGRVDMIEVAEDQHLGANNCMH